MRNKEYGYLIVADGYYPLYTQFVKIAAHSPSLEPEAVTQVVKEAIESPEPKARYLVKDGSHLDAFIGMDDEVKDAQLKKLMGV